MAISPCERRARLCHLHAASSRPKPVKTSGARNSLLDGDACASVEPHQVGGGPHGVRVAGARPTSGARGGQQAVEFPASPLSASRWRWRWVGWTHI